MKGRNAGNRHDLFRILNQESTGVRQSLTCFR